MQVHFRSPCRLPPLIPRREIVCVLGFIPSLLILGFASPKNRDTESPDE
jgi:hypothetical protein